MLIGVLPNKEGTRETCQIQCSIIIVRRPSAEPSKPGRNACNLRLQKTVPLQRRQLAHLQSNPRRQQDMNGELCVGGRCAMTALKAEGAKLAKRNLMVGQHDGLVISCGGIDQNLSLYVRSVAR